MLNSSISFVQTLNTHKENPQFSYVNISKGRIRPPEAADRTVVKSVRVTTETSRKQNKTNNCDPKRSNRSFTFRKWVWWGCNDVETTHKEKLWILFETAERSDVKKKFLILPNHILKMWFYGGMKDGWRLVSEHPGLRGSAAVGQTVQTRHVVRRKSTRGALFRDKTNMLEMTAG